MDPETLLRSAERTNVSTMRKLMPLGGWTSSNLIFQNSQGCYNLQNFGIGRWLWKSFLRSTEFFPMFEGLYPDEDNQLGDEEPTDDIDEYEEVDEGLSGDVSNYNEEEIEYVDFLGVEDILDSPNNDVDEFYTDEENYMFIREVTTDPFLSIFMACEREKEQKRYGKSEELTSSVLGFHNKHRSMLMMKSVALIVGYCLVLIVRKVKWNELTGRIDCGLLPCFNREESQVE
jgi:hypothetical protein